MNKQGLFGFIWHPIVRLLTILLVITFCVLFVYTLLRVNTGDPTFAAVKDVSLHGLTISGTIPVQNNGVVPVTVENIPYTITLDGTNTTLASGTVDGFILGPGEKRDAPFSVILNWAGGKSAIGQGFSEGSVNVTIEASVRLRPLGVVTIPVPVTQHLDLVEYAKKGSSQSFADTALNEATKESSKGFWGTMFS